MVQCGVCGWCAVVCGVFWGELWCAVVNEIFVWCAVVQCLWCAVVHDVSGINGVRCGGCGMQKSSCGVLWWLSYINCFFRFFGAALVGRVGVITLLPASPAQFKQLKHCLNVIYEIINYNLIFSENRFFFVKKKCTKKNSAPIRFYPKIKFKNSITSRISGTLFSDRMVRSRNLCQLADLKLTPGLDY